VTANDPAGSPGGNDAVFQPPKWRKPGSLGYPAALDAVGNVAAPLLAGLSLASIMTIAANTSHFRWAGAAVLTLTIATLLLVNAVQCNFHARRNLWSPDDVRNWWPELSEHADWEERLREEQAAALRRWRTWSVWTTRLYNAGICTLLIGLGCALAPAEGGSVGACRWAAAVCAFAAAAGELAWAIATSRRTP
jgi:hypothetical protein